MFDKFNDIGPGNLSKLGPQQCRLVVFWIWLGLPELSTKPEESLKYIAQSAFASVSSERPIFPSGGAKITLSALDTSGKSPM